jgi:hypothetical protein
MLYHQGQRNYECPKCNNKFYQMEHLKRHLTSIHKLNIPQIGRGNRLFGSDLLKRVRRTHRSGQHAVIGCRRLELILFQGVYRYNYFSLLKHKVLIEQLCFSDFVELSSLIISINK